MKYRFENVVVVTAVHVPIYVKFVASLGSKFSYHTCDEDDGNSVIFDFALCFEKMKERVDDFVGMKTFHSEKKKFLDKQTRFAFRNRADRPTKAQIFIKMQMKRAKAYLSKNRNVRIIPADKGGKIVITDLETYRNKVIKHLDMNVKIGTYSRCEGLSREYIKDVCEVKYKSIRDLLNPFFGVDRSLNFENVCRDLCFEPFVIPRFYGSFKVHKEDYPVRPIISSTNSIGQSLSLWMLKKLNVIAEHLRKHQVKSSKELFDKIEGVKIRDKHVLSTWDFDNMFTNIPCQLVKDVIREYYYLVQGETTLPMEEFLIALTFLIEDCAFFVFEGVIYLQVEGLSMGNRLSQVLAEIVTSYFLNRAILKCGENVIDFVYKYVDDIISALDESHILYVQSLIEEELEGMKLKLTKEDECGKVEFLQMKVERTSDNVIRAMWNQKGYSSKRILDFHSFHPRKMKFNVVKEYVRSALSLTSLSNKRGVIKALRKALKGSNYPDYFINRVIDSLKGEPRARSVEVSDRSFVACPYVPGPMHFVRRTAMKISKSRISLCPTIVSNNRREIYSNVKDARNLGERVNASFVIRCLDCDFHVRMYASVYDIETTVRLALGDDESKMCVHAREFGHAIDLKLGGESVFQYRNKRDVNFARDSLDN